MRCSCSRDTCPARALETSTPSSPCRTIQPGSLEGPLNHGELRTVGAAVELVPGPPGSRPARPEGEPGADVLVGQHEGVQVAPGGPCVWVGCLEAHLSQKELQALAASPGDGLLEAVHANGYRGHVGATTSAVGVKVQVELNLCVLKRV